MEPLSEAEEFDSFCAELWSETEGVEITDAPLDQNPPHGHNSPDSLDRGDSVVSHVIARAKGILGRFL